MVVESAQPLVKVTTKCSVLQLLVAPVRVATSEYWTSQEYVLVLAAPLTIVLSVSS
jgi:hypothetical protein